MYVMHRITEVATSQLMRGGHFSYSVTLCMMTMPELEFKIDRGGIKMEEE